MNDPNRILSPCIQVCVRDLNDICMGCYRSIDEIQGWYNFSDKEKLQTIKNASGRKSKKTKLVNTITMPNLCWY